MDRTPAAASSSGPGGAAVGASGASGSGVGVGLNLDDLSYYSSSSEQPQQPFKRRIASGNHPTMSMDEDTSSVATLPHGPPNNSSKQLPAALATTLLMDFQESISEVLNSKLKQKCQVSGKGKKKAVQEAQFEIALWSGFPRNTEVYLSFLRNINQIAEADPESIVAASLQWLPFENGLSRQVPWDFPSFVSRLMNFSGSLREQDIIAAVVKLMVADILAVALKYFDGYNVQTSTVNRVLSYAFASFRLPPPQALYADLWNDMHEQMGRIYSLVLRWMSKHRMPLVVNSVQSLLSSGSLKDEDAIRVYRNLRLLCMNPPSGDPSVPISELMGFLYDQLVALGNRKTPVRLAILDALHSLILQLDFSESSTEELDVLLAQTHKLINKVTALSNVQDLAAPCFSIISSYLQRCPRSEFRSLAENFWQNTILSCRKRHASRLAHAALIWLQGPHFSARDALNLGSDLTGPLPHALRRDLIHVFFRKSNSFTVLDQEEVERRNQRDPDFLQGDGFVYQSVSRPLVSNTTIPTMVISSLPIFFRKFFMTKYAPGHMLENLNVYADVLVHIALLDFDFFREQVMVLLDKESTPTEFYLVSFRALRKILDPEFRFLQNAIRAPTVSISEAAFEGKLEELRSDAEKALKIGMHLCDIRVGLQRGTAIESVPVTSYRTENDYFVDVEDVLGDEETNKHDADGEGPMQDGRRVNEEIRTADEFWSRSASGSSRGDTFAEEQLFQNALAFLSNNMGDFATADQQFEKTQNLAFAELRKKKDMKDEDAKLLVLYKELLRALPVMCPDELLLSEDPNIFVGSLLLHFDSGVSRACSHALQRVVTEQQHIRYRLMEGILNLILRLEAESHQLYTLVDNVRQLLTELIGALKSDQRIGGGHLSREQRSRLDDLSVKGDASVLRIFCTVDTNVRRMGLEVARHISKVRRFLEEEDEDQIDLFDVQKHFCLYDLIQRHQADAFRSTVQRIIELAPIGSAGVKITGDFPVRLMDELAKDVYTLVWPFLVGEIATIFSKHGFPKTIVHLQGVMLWRVSELIKNAPRSKQDANRRPNFSHHKYYLKHLSETILLHAVIDPSSGISRSDRTLLSLYGPGEDGDMLAYSEGDRADRALEEKILDLMESHFELLASEIPWVSQVTALNATFVHPNAVGSAMLALSDWWTQASRRRKRSGSGPDWLQFKYHNVFSGLCQNLKVGGGMVHGDSALSLVRQEHADVNTLAGASNFKQCKTAEEVTLMQRLFVDLNFITLRIARAFNHIPVDERLPLLDNVWNISQRQALLHQLSRIWSEPQFLDGTSDILHFLGRKPSPEVRESYLQLTMAIARRAQTLAGLALEEVVQLGPFLTPLSHSSMGVTALGTAHQQQAASRQSGYVHSDTGSESQDGEFQPSSAAYNPYRLDLFSSHNDISVIDPYLLLQQSGLSVLEAVAEHHGWLLSLLTVGFFQHVNDPSTCLPIFNTIVSMFLHTSKHQKQSHEAVGIMTEKFRTLSQLKMREDMDVPARKDLTPELRERFRECRHGLLQMCVYMLGHPTSELRAMAFDLLLAFCPIWETRATGSILDSMIRPLRVSFHTHASAQVKKAAFNADESCAKQLQSYTRSFLMDGLALLQVVRDPKYRIWIAEYLEPWCANVDLSGTEDDGVLVSELYSTALLLQSSFQSDAASALWERLAEKPLDNLLPVAHYLMNKTLGNAEDIQFCGKVFSNLFRVERSAILEVLLAEISPERYTQAIAVDHHGQPASPRSSIRRTRSGMVLGQDEVLEAMDMKRLAELKGRRLAEMELRRKAVVKLFPALLSQLHSRDELLEILPRLFVFALLSSDGEQPVEGYNPNTLILTIIHQVMGHFEDRSPQQRTLSTLKMYLENPAFKLNWRCEKFQETYEKFNDDVIREYLPTSQEDLAQYQRLYPVVLGEVDAVLFVQKFCFCLSSLSDYVQTEIGNECLAWCSQGGDPEYRVKAVTIFRSILSPLSKESVHVLLKQLDAALRVVERGWEKRRIASQASRASIKSRFLWRILSLGDTACFAPGLLEALECLNAVSSMAMVLRSNGRASEFPELFWTALAVMRSPLPSLYQPAVRMLQTLASDGSVYEVAFVGKVSDKPRFLEYAQGWDPEFSGVQPLLLRGLMDESLEEDTFNFLSGLIVADCREMVDSGPSRELMSVLPFLIVIWRELDANCPAFASLSTHEVASYLIDMLRESEKGLAARPLMTLLDTYRNHQVRPEEVDVFFARLCQQVSQLYLPDLAAEAADFLTNMFVSGPEHNQIPVIKIAACMLSGRNADLSVYLFQDLIKLVSQQLRNKALSSAAGEMLAFAVRAATMSAHASHSVTEETELLKLSRSVADRRKLKNSLSGLGAVIEVASQYVDDSINFFIQRGRKLANKAIQGFEAEEEVARGSMRRSRSQSRSPVSFHRSRSPSGGSDSSSMGHVYNGSNEDLFHREPRLASDPQRQSFLSSSAVREMAESAPKWAREEERQIREYSDSRFNAYDERIGSGSRAPMSSRGVDLSVTETAATPSLVRGQSPSAQSIMAIEEMQDRLRALGLTPSSQSSGPAPPPNLSGSAVMSDSRVSAAYGSGGRPRSSVSADIEISLDSSSEDEDEGARASQSNVRTVVEPPNGRMVLDLSRSTPTTSSSGKPQRSAPKVPSHGDKEPPTVTALLHTSNLRVYFERFLRANFDTDSLNFYLAVMDYLGERSESKQAMKARVIIERFVSLDSFDSIDIDEGTRMEILRVFQKNSLSPPQSLFDQAQREVLHTIHTLMYPSFLKSPEYTQLLSSGHW